MDTKQLLERNALSIYAVSFLAVFLAVYISYTSGFVLLNIYGIDVDGVGTETAYVNLVDQLTSVVAALAWGIFLDMWGPRLQAASAFTAVGIGTFLTELPVKNIDISAYYVGRVIYAIGLSGVMTLLSYLMTARCSAKSIGPVAGIGGMFCGVGAITGSIGFGSKLNAAICLQPTNYIVTAISLVSAVALFFLIPRQSPEWCNEDDIPVKQGFKEKSKAMCRLVRGSSKLCIALTGSFLARAVSSMIVTFVPLAMMVRAVEGGEINEDEIEDNSCGELNYSAATRGPHGAYATAMKITGILHTLTLIASPFIGYLCRWLSTRKTPLKDYLTLFVFSALSVICYPLLGLKLYSDNADIYILSTLAGVLEAGLIIGASALLNTAGREHNLIRGSMSGLFSVCGSVGILVVNMVGGALFDILKDGEHAYWYLPFVLFGIFCLFQTLFIGAIMWRHRKDVPEVPPSQVPEESSASSSEAHKKNTSVSHSGEKVYYSSASSEAHQENTSVSHSGEKVYYSHSI